jgi:hypothetical protein
MRMDFSTLFLPHYHSFFFEPLFYKTENVVCDFLVCLLVCLFVSYIMTLELKKFDMRTITFKPNESKGPVCVLIGRRDTGKSFLVRDLLYYHQDIPIGVVIAGTEEGNGFYGKLVPKLFIHNEYNTAIIENILKRQKNVLKQVKKEMESFKRSNIDPRAFVILDDCLYDSTWSRDKMMRLLFMNGRHWKIMLIITMQYPLGIPPNLRTNIDCIYITRTLFDKSQAYLGELCEYVSDI